MWNSHEDAWLGASPTPAEAARVLTDLGVDTRQLALYAIAKLYDGTQDPFFGYSVGMHGTTLGVFGTREEQARWYRRQTQDPSTWYAVTFYLSTRPLKTSLPTAEFSR